MNELDKVRCPILNLPENIKLVLKVSLFMYEFIPVKSHFFLGVSMSKPPPNYVILPKNDTLLFLVIV